MKWEVMFQATVNEVGSDVPCDCQWSGRWCSKRQSMKWEVMFQATVNEVGGDVPSDCQWSGRWCSKRLSMKWEVMFQATVNEVEGDVPSDCQWSGRWCSMRLSPSPWHQPLGGFHLPLHHSCYLLAHLPIANLSMLPSPSHRSSEDRGSIFLRKTVTHLQVYTMSQCRIQKHYYSSRLYSV